MKLARVNNLLLALIILINGYIIAAPFAPQVVFWWNSHHTERRQQLVKALHVSESSTSKNNGKNAAKPQPNHIIIPSMLLNEPIYEGRDTYAELNKGIWHLPASSSPDKGGNTVLLGHRFTYTQPQGVLYYLNKVQKGNEIGVWWNNKKYLYKVAVIKEVPPTNTAIEANTKRAELTIYTCTPLWLPKNRLVIVAYLQEET